MTNAYLQRFAALGSCTALLAMAIGACGTASSTTASSFVRRCDFRLSRNWARHRLSEQDDYDWRHRRNYRRGFPTGDSSAQRNEGRPRCHQRRRRNRRMEAQAPL